MHARPHPPAAAEQRLQAERAALDRAAQALAAKPSYAAYKALMTHYDHCHGCAYATAPCAEGRQLRRAWVAVRWS
ncbi:hypothetical protein ACU639_13695 [Streptomyces cynarae]|uniref:hypothetical protein n=1 Tax=Streptomyces cynarae TaxID=2981134 RepID=UPI00406D0A82